MNTALQCTMCTTCTALLSCVRKDMKACICLVVLSKNIENVCVERWPFFFFLAVFFWILLEFGLRHGPILTGSCVGLAGLCDAASQVWTCSESTGRGDFCLGVDMVSDSISPKLGWEYKLRSSLCTHALHHTDSEDPDILVLDRWIPATKTHPACIIHEDGMWVPLWLESNISHICKNLTRKKNKMNTRDIPGNAEEEDNERKFMKWLSLWRQWLSRWR